LWWLRGVVRRRVGSKTLSLTPPGNRKLMVAPRVHFGTLGNLKSE
jgi:hypothetical protein